MALQKTKNLMSATLPELEELENMGTDSQIDYFRKLTYITSTVLFYYTFLSNLFEGSEALLRLADNIEEIKTICWCGSKATQTARLNEDGYIVREGSQIDIGGNDKYTVVCRKHFMSGEAKPISVIEDENSDKKRA